MIIEVPVLALRNRMLSNARIIKRDERKSAKLGEIVRLGEIVGLKSRIEVYGFRQRRTSLWLERFTVYDKKRLTVNSPDGYRDGQIE